MNKKPLKKDEVFKIFKSIKILKQKTEIVNIWNSNNRVISENLRSLINVPPFNNSAVDGYAIIFNNLKNNNKFKIIAKIRAGDNKNIILKKNEAVRIFTGARIPRNADTIVMQENAYKKNEFVFIKKIPKKNENCRIAGEDITKGKLIFKKGTIIKTFNKSLLASIGRKNIKVYKKLSVGFFTNGNELKKPTTKLIGSQINNSNNLALFSLIEECGFKANDLGTLKDSPKDIRNLINKAINKYDVIITAGGASVGEEDHLIKVINDIGKNVFWKVAIKPGRPLGFATINKKPIICLPGNPVSVFLLFAMLVKPFLFRLAGSLWKEPDFIPAKINFNMKKKTERMEWLRVSIKKRSKELIVSKYPRQGSGIISSIVFSDGIIEIPENKSKLSSGDIFNFYPIDFIY